MRENCNAAWKSNCRIWQPLGIAQLLGNADELDTCFVGECRGLSPQQVDRVLATMGGLMAFSSAW